MKTLLAAADAIARGTPAAMATVIGVNGSAPRHAGSRMLVYSDGRIVGTVGGGNFEHRVIAEALEAIKTGCPRRVTVHLTRDLGMCCGGAMDTFIEPLASREELVIYGAGHVGAAVAAAAAPLGVALTVVDSRDAFLAPDRFPPGTTLVEADARVAIASLPMGPLAYHLVLTHDHQLDQDIVERLLPMDLAWLGMIGSRAKVARFLVRFRAAGIDPALFTRLSAPVGLDLGAETPEEIAISIVAQFVRMRRGSRSSPAPLSETPIAARGGDGRARPPTFDRT